MELAGVARQRFHWSQAEIARRLDVERATVNGIFKGRSEPSRVLVRLFEFVIMQEDKTGVRKPDALELDEEQRGDVMGEVWKRRALTAERMLEEIRGIVKDLPAKGVPAEQAPKAKISSAQKRLAESLRNMAHAKQQEEEQKGGKQHPE